MSKPYVILDGGSDFIVGQRYFLRHTLTSNCRF